jgi:sec-independent protein translocase protein TatA
MEASFGSAPSALPLSATHNHSSRSETMLAGHLPELLIVLTVALVIFGPKRLPEIGSSLGKGIRDFRQSLSHLENEVTQHQPPSVVEPLPITAVVPDHKAG